MSNDFIKIRRLSCVLCFLIGFVYFAQAQNSKSVSGQVLDAKDKSPIVGASIWVKNTTTGVITDLDGRFKIEVERTSNVLQISYIGYQSVDLVLNGKTDFKIELEEEAERLQEVVVTGSTTQQKQSITGAISTIEVSKLKAAGAPKVSTLLAGQIAGVVSMTRSGEPGAGSEFYIRGISTFAGSNSPLVLVDGIERDMNLIDTEDIASFSVLKDASASAIYGVRGANGVIIITTNRGQIGKPKVNVRAEKGISAPIKMPELANSAQWAEMYNEASGKKFYSDEAIQKYASNSDSDLYPNENWINRLYKPFADNQTVKLNISGGNDFTKYYVSGSYYNENSVFKQADDIYDYRSSPDFTRFNFRANLDINLSKSTVVRLDLSNIYQKTFGPGTDVGTIWSQVFGTSPNVFPYKYSDGTISGASTATGGAINPWNSLVHSGYRENFWSNSQALIGLNQNLDFITKGLNLSVKYSWDSFTSSYITRSKTPTHFYAASRADNGSLIFGPAIVQGQESLGYNHSSSGDLVTYLDAVINYERTFAVKHKLNAFFMYNHRIKTNTQSGDQINSIPYKNQGISGRFAYAFDNKLFIETNMGYNGSENFAPGHRFGFFPSVSAGWLVSQEEFMQKIQETISYLKIRGSHGMVGNDGISGRRFIYQATIVDGNHYSYGDANDIGGRGLRQGDPENRLVSWEEAIKSNIGIEIELFSKLKLNLDVFNENRQGIFIERSSLSDLVGMTSKPLSNVGKAVNRGFDGTLEYNAKVGEVKFTARAIYNFSRNRLLDNDQPDWKYKYLNRIGKPIGQRFGLVALGLFESDEEIASSPEQKFGAYRVGDIKYQDVNGDGLVDNYDRVAIGYSTLPEINYGLGGTMSWKGIDLNLLFQGVDNTQFHLGGNSIFAFSSNNTATSAFNSDIYHHAWKSTNTIEENSKSIYPRQSIGGQAGSSNNRENSTFWLRDGSFTRLKLVELGYTLPKSILKNTFIRNVRIYCTGNNLLTFSAFKLWDPERGNGDGSGYPLNRSVLFGLNADF